MENELKHYGILGMKWGIRRYQPYSTTGPRKGGKTGIEKGEARKVESRNESGGGSVTDSSTDFASGVKDTRKKESNFKLNDKKERSTPSTAQEYDLAIKKMEYERQLKEEKDAKRRKTKAAIKRGARIVGGLALGTIALATIADANNNGLSNAVLVGMNELGLLGQTTTIGSLDLGNQSIKLTKTVKKY